jgi:hypothetical protein
VRQPPVADSVESDLPHNIEQVKQAKVEQPNESKPPGQLIKNTDNKAGTST